MAAQRKNMQRRTAGGHVAFPTTTSSSGYASVGGEDMDGTVVALYGNDNGRHRTQSPLRMASNDRPFDGTVFMAWFREGISHDCLGYDFIWTTSALWIGPIVVLASLFVCHVTEWIGSHLPISAVDANVVPSMVFVAGCKVVAIVNASRYATVAGSLVLMGTLGSICSWLEELFLELEQKDAADFGSFNRFLQRSPYQGPTRQLLPQLNNNAV
jgi:hypothetical protein